ncbi:putative leucine-rich repeat-containing protein DDB_G0290503 isoform X2 [Limulus polyphemus]|uniref:Leucine-rich repeat-containing protein DDB_G0290503 isoform X2 n=1 Tax=Limulus polyphemus TaxID=6850 RepID=A0ABM1RZW2_LIMPO|nr:putative leucine-rich repeat-containing protein DDB_G0290503 isoform X2 [Limulus polyphemus]
MLGIDRIDKNEIDAILGEEKCENNQSTEMLKYQMEEEENNEACVEENSDRDEDIEILGEDKNEIDRTNESPVEEKDEKGKISEMFAEGKTGIFETQKEEKDESIQLLEESKGGDIIESSKEENTELLRKCQTGESSFYESSGEEKVEIDGDIKTLELDKSEENVSITMFDEKKSQNNIIIDIIRENKDENTENCDYKSEKDESGTQNNESCKLFGENKTKEKENEECRKDCESIEHEINELHREEHSGEFESKVLVKKETEINKNNVLHEEETAEDKGDYKILKEDHSGNNMETAVDSLGVDLFEDMQSSLVVIDANENVQELQMVEEDEGAKLQEEIMLAITNNEHTHISVGNNEVTYSRNKRDEVEIVSEEETKPIKQFNHKDKIDFSRIDVQNSEDNVEQTLKDEDYSFRSIEETFSVKASVSDLSISNSCVEGIVVLDQNNDESDSMKTLENKEDEELSYKTEYPERCDAKDISVTQNCTLKEQDNAKSTESTTQGGPDEYEEPHMTEGCVQEDDIIDESDTLLDIENSTENEGMDFKEDETLKVVDSEELPLIEKVHIGHIKSYEGLPVDAVKEEPCIRTVIDQDCPANEITELQQSSGDCDTSSHLEDSSKLYKLPIESVTEEPCFKTVIIQDCPADKIRESERYSKSGDHPFVFDDLKSLERRSKGDVSLPVISTAATNDCSGTRGLNFSLISVKDQTVGNFNQKNGSKSTIIPAETEHAIELDEELIKKHYEDMNSEGLLDLRDMMKDSRIGKKQAPVEEDDIIKVDAYMLEINALQEPFEDQSVHLQQDSEFQVEDHPIHQQDSEVQVGDPPVHRQDSEVQVENEIQNSLQERVQELETIVNEMQEVEQQHMTVACKMAEQLDQLKQREAKLQKELEATEQAKKVESSPRKQTNSQKCYLDELAAWKENVELQNSVLQKLRVELDLGQQQLDTKEKEVGALQNEIKELHHRLNQMKGGIYLDNDMTHSTKNSNIVKEEQLLKTIEKLRAERSVYRHQLEVQQKVARDVRSQLDSTASRLVSLKTEAASRYHKIVDHQRDMIQKKERQIKRLKTELHHVTCDLHEKVVLLDKQKRDIREMNNQLDNSEKELKDKTKLLEELQFQVSGGINSQTSEDDCQTEEQKLSSIGTRCLSEKHLQTISSQAEELEEVRSQMKHLTGITSSQDGICEAEEEVARLQKEVVSLKAQLAEFGIENGGGIKEATIQEIMKLSEHNHTYLMRNIVNFLELNLPDIHKSLKDVSLLEWQEVLQSRQKDLEHLGNELTNLKEQILIVYKHKIDNLDEALDMAKKEIKRLMVENEEKNEHIQCLRDMLQRTQESLEREHLLHSGRGQKASKGGRDQRVPLELKNGQILALEEELNKQEKEMQRTERKLRNMESKMATTSKKMTLS